MKYKFIDSARGIAILMVILVHTASDISNLNIVLDFIAKYSQMGVQLFFVASAFTLCLSSVNRSNEERPLLSYALRRYFRVAPIYYLGILLYTLLFYLGIFSYRYLGDSNPYTFDNIFYNVFFLNGFVPEANNVIVPGGWSISTEMTFYLFFPLLFLIASKFITSMVRLILYIFLGIILSQALDLYMINQGYYLANNTFLYYNIINQLPCFIIGIGYYFYSTRLRIEYRKIYDYVLCSFFIFFCLILWSLKIGYLFSWTPVLSSFSFVFLIEIFRKNEKLNISILSSIGKVSFSMYLFHFLFTYSIPLLPSFIVDGGDTSLFILFLLIVSLSYLVARLSYKWIEKPFIALGSQLISKINSHS